MTRSFAISFAVHAGLLLAALFVLPAPPPFKVAEPTPISVDISTISDKVQKQATTKDKVADTKDDGAKETKVTKDVPPAPKPAEKVKLAAREQKPPPEPEDPVPPEPKPDPVPPKPKPAPVPPEPKDDPVPPEPKPDPITKTETKALDNLFADEQKKLDEQKKAEEKKQAEEKRKADEKRKKDEQKKKLDKALADAQMQLNKIAGESAAPQKSAEKKGTAKQADKDAAGNDGAASATIASALVSKVKGCFTIPPAAREANVSVPIHFILNRDGSVQGQPEAMTNSTDPVIQATARAAISAIVECQMYDLPADKYDLWKDNELDFNPKRLSG